MKPASPAGAFVLAIEGAESTGKSRLADELTLWLERRGVAVRRVDEHLREFTAAQGRPPRHEEQAGIATRQSEAIAQAATASGVALVIADTSALMTAVYSEVIFHDPSLYETVWPQRRADFSLLMGRDLPWTPDGIQRDGPAVQARVDAALRAALTRQRLPHAVIYGQGDERRRAALQALQAACPEVFCRPPLAAPDEDTAAPLRRWRKVCLDCLDPECEHLLPRPEDGAAPGRQ